MPVYTLVGQTQITVALPGEKAYTVPAGDIPIQEYDVIGIQVLQGQTVVKCEDLPTGKNQQTAYKATFTGWLEKTEIFPSTSTPVDLTCYIQALHTKDSKQYFPQNLAYSSVTGDYDLSVSIVESDTHNLRVLLEETVADVSWVYPPLRVAPTSSTSLGTVYTTWNQAYNFTVRVERGTNVDSVWSFDNTKTVPLTGSCTSDVIALVANECNETLYWSDTPYATVEHTTTTTGTFTLSINFTNVLGRTEKQLTVMTEKEITGVSFNLVTPNRIKNNVAVNRVTEFETTITDGTGVTYSFTVDGTAVPATNSSLFYTFTGKQTYMVEAIVTNILGSQSDTLTVYAKKPAEFKNCQFLLTPYIAAVGIAKNLTLQCSTNTDAEVSTIWMLSDRSNNITSAITTTIFSTKVWNQAVTFNSVQMGVQVTAFATDPFEEVSTTVTVDVYNAIPSIDLSCSTFQITPSDTVSFVASVPSSPGSYGTVTYTFDYNDGSSPETSSTGITNHVFASKGNYTVTVIASNGPSSQTTTQHIEVYELVKNLTVSYNGPKKEGEIVTFTATVLEGNFLTYRFYSADFDVSQSSGVFAHTFSSAADYVVVVECFNTLSKLNATLTAYILRTDEIRITAMKLNDSPFSGCLETGITYQFSVEIIHYDAATVTYDWNFGNSVLLTNDGSVQNQGYTTARNYTVTVTAKYGTTSSVTETQEVCVEEAVTTPTIQISSPLGLPPSGSLTKSVTVSVRSGNNLKYSWSTNATAGASTNDAVFDVTFDTEGWYEITVTVSNSINSLTESKIVQVVTEISGLNITCTACKEQNGDLYVEINFNHQFAVSKATGTGVTYTWDFGDSNSASGTSASHSYASVGSYNLTVTASNPVSASHVESVMIYVETRLTQVTLNTYSADWIIRNGNQLLDITKTAVFKADVQPQNMIITFDWQFDTGMTPVSSFTEVGSHNYSTTGKKACNVTASNMLNSVVSSALDFYIIEEITAINVTDNGKLLDASLTHIVAVNEMSIFNATSTQIVAGTATYLFVFKNSAGQLIGSNSDNFINWHNYSFSIAGDYTLSIRVTVEKDFDVTYNIEAVKPVSGAYISTPQGTDGNITLGSSFTLSCGAIEGKYIQYRWFYSIAPTGESIPAPNDGPNITITPGALGTYVITAELYNSVSVPQQVNYTLNVMIGVSGVAIDVNMPFPDAVKEGSTLTFNGLVAAGTDITYSWIASYSGTTIQTGNSQTFVVNFSHQALYNITLHVENYASSETAYKEVYSLYEVPAFDINVTGGSYLNSIRKYVATTGDNVNFSSTISNTDFINFDWKVNGTTFAATELFQIGFTNPSEYRVALFASNKISQESNEQLVLVQDAVTGLSVQFCEATFEVSTAITLMATAVSGSDLLYKWEGNGQVVTTPSNIHMVNFHSVGDYSINVTASNYVSEETKYCTLTILGRIGNLALSKSQYQFVLFPITLTVTGDYIDPANFTWVFSDGRIFETVSPTFDVIFGNQGFFSVIVYVSNAVSNDSVTMDFNVEDLICHLPTLTVDGSTERTTFRARPVEFAVTVSTQGCTNYTSVNKWKVYAASSCSASLVNEFPLSSDIETSTPVLQLPGATLDYETYCVTFTHSYANTPVLETKKFNLTIEASDLKALINGGDEFSASEGSSLTLDASASYDPDNTTGTTLNYAWSCSQTMVSFYNAKLVQEIF